MAPANAHVSKHPDGETPAAAPSPAEAAFERAVMELFEPTADVLGIPRSIAGIYAVIFASPRPLSFADVEDRLQLSKGSVSQGLRVLRDVGAIKPVRPASNSLIPSLPHSPPSLDAGANAAPRRDYYVPDMQLRQLVARLLKDRIEPQLAGGSRRLTQLVESVPFADPAAADLVRGRLKHLQTWQRKARKLVPFAKTLLALGQP
jgi:hypothetical protein